MIIHMIISKFIRITMIIHSLPLFDILTKAYITTERRLMIDLKSSTDSYQDMELDFIVHIKTEHNVADALTKIRKYNFLEDVITTSKLNHPFN